MTATQTLYAPNPPQIDEPWLKAVVVVIALVLIAALAAGA